MALLAVPMLLAPTLSFAASSTQEANRVAVSAACKGIDIDPKGAPSCAAVLEKTFNADPAMLAGLKATAKTNDQRSAKALLIKAGLDMGQLEKSTIMFMGRSAAPSRKVVVTIECCPLVITMRF